MDDTLHNLSQSARLFDRAEQVIPGGVSHPYRYRQPHPIYFVRAEGAYKWDAEGRRYIDYKMGSASQMLGHCPPKVVEAVRRQMGVAIFTADCHELEVHWAEAVCSLYPAADMIRFVGSGSEATMLAIRVARAHSGRDKVLRIDGHYHGWHDHVVKGSRPGVADVPSLGVPEAVSALMVVAPADLAAIEAALMDAEIGTVIVEASGANYGAVPLPEGFLPGVRQLCDRLGKVLIFDEVITGFRWSPGGRQARDGVTPDLFTMAKILTGGLPGGGLAGRREIMSLLDPRQSRGALSPPVMHQGTFNGCQIVAAGALAAFEDLSTGEPQAHADRIAAMIREGVAEILVRHNIQGACYGESSTFHLYLGPCDGRSVTGLTPAQIRGTDKKVVAALRDGLYDHGVDLMSAMSGVTSWAHSYADAAETLDAFDAALAGLTAKGMMT
ncbi:MAG TPA: aminotransferase class III-fold pyridoxal phosphate-dependent enzyme [Thermohalobaculum sp.]|nr:aminotransferase class III-fold pyridoxal phosphate-dependent enzyme [Thermohalobaculum sp.]